MPQRFPKFFFESVQGRLVLLAATITCSALLLGLLLVGQAFSNERKAVEKHISATARALATGVDLQLGQYQALLQGLSTFPSLQRIDLEAFDRAARAVAEGNETWIVLAEADGQQIVNTKVPRGTPLPKIEISEEQRKAMEVNKPYVSNVALSAIAHKPVLFVSLRVKLQGRPYYLFFNTVPEVFAHGLAVQRLAPDGTVAIIDRKGIVAARNRAPEKFIGTPASADMKAAIEASPFGVLESVTLDGIPVLTAFYRSHCGWTVINAVPRADIYGSAAQLVTLALALSGVLLAIAFILSGWIGRTLVQGVGTLVQSTKDIGNGKKPTLTHSGLAEIDFVSQAINETAETLAIRQKERDEAEEALREESRVLEILNQTGAQIASQLDLQTILQFVTDSATKLSAANFGAFFYNTTDAEGKAYMLFTLSGAPREAFEKFGHPRATPMFAPTFLGEGIVRVDDVTKDPRYGTMAPHYGMPKGHLPVRSYLAVPVISRSGKVIGGLFFGHREVGMFTARAERLVAGVAAQASVAIDNAMLYETSQREIAERKKAEAELQKAKDELEIKVQERTASLQETTEQLETFCYSIAHDLRAPLRSQLGFAQVLRDEYNHVLDDTGRDFADRIVRGATRLDALVNDLLSYSRITRGQFQFAPVDMDKTVREVLSYFAEEIERTKAAINLGVLHKVCAHESTLNLVITNLIGNALKFIAPGTTPTVIIYSEQRDNFVRLWVIDNGIGINELGLTKIFGVFERLHPVNVYPGTGIGLAIVQKAVERMGGQVGVESTPGVGSRFWIELPKV